MVTKAVEVTRLRPGGWGGEGGGGIISGTNYESDMIF